MSKSQRQMVTRAGRRLVLFSAAVTAAMLAHRPAQAATFYWDAGLTPASPAGGTGTWDLNTTANWSNLTSDVKWTDNAALGTDLAVFGGTFGAVTLNSNLSALGLQFTTTGYTISGSGTLTLGSGGIDASSLTSGSTTISNNLTLAGTQSWNVGSGGTLAINGTLVRNNGVLLSINNNTSNGSGVYTSSSIANSNNIIGTWAVYGSGTSLAYATNNAGTISAYTSYTGTGDANIATPAGITAINGTTNYNLSGTTNATAGASASFNTLRYTGAGLTITTATAMTANGIMNAGTGALTITGTAVTIGASKELDIFSNGQNITLNNGVVNNAGGASSIYYSGSGTLSFGGTALANTGGLNVYGGMVTSTNNTSPYGTTNLITLGDPTVGNSNNATLQYGNGSGNASAASGIVVNAGSSGTLTITANNSSSESAPITLKNNLTLISSNTINGKNFTLSGTVTESGTAPLTITAKNDTSGTSNAGVILSNTVTVSSGGLTLTNVANGGIFNLTNTTTTVNGTGNLTVNNNSTNAGTMTIGTGAISNTGSVTLNNNSTGTVTVSGAVSNTGNLITNSNSTGAITVSGAVNTTGSVTNSGSSTGGVTLSGIIGTAVTGGVIQNSTTSPLTLGGVVNTFTSGLKVQQGTVIGGGNANTFGANANVITLGTASSSANATLVTTSSQTYANPIAIASGDSGSLVITDNGGAGNPNFSGAITFGGSASTLTYLYSGTAVPTISASSITGTGNLLINLDNAKGMTFSAASINNAGSITNAGSGISTVTLSGGLGANVSSVNQNSWFSPLTVSGTNTNFAGSTNLQAGILKLGSATALGGNGSTTGAGGALNISAGTTLDVSAATALTTVNAESWAGSFFFVGSNTLNTGTGAVTLGQSLTVTALTTPTGANALTVGGVVGQAASGYSLTKAGAGTLVLSAQPTYTGGTIVNGGGLVFGAALPATGSVTVNTGGIAATGISNSNAFLSSINSSSTGAVGINVNNNSAFDFSVIGANGLSLGATAAATYSGTLTPYGQTYRFGGGTATLTDSINLPNVNALPTNILKVGTDTVALSSNPSTSITGGITVNGGSLFLNGSASNVTSVTINPGGNLQVGNGSGAGSIATGVTITDNGTLSYGRSDNQTQSSVFGTITGSGNLSQARSGAMLTLNAANTYTGTTTLTGSINAGIAEGVGSGPMGNGGVIRFNGGTLQYSASNNYDYSGRIANSSSAIIIDTNSRTVTFASPLAATNTGGLTLNDTNASKGTLILSTANNYYGTTTITAGTLQLNNAAAISNSTVSIAQANGLAFNNAISGGSTYTAGALAGAGNELLQDISSNAVTLQIGKNNSAQSYTGVLSGTGSIAKIGTATQTFTGNNSYSGGTSVTGTAGGALASTLASSGTPFGTGAMTLTGATLSMAPTGSGSAIAYSGPNATSGNVFTYAGGSALSLAKGTQTSVTYTIGGGGTAALARSGAGTLTIKPSATTTLGSSEFVKISGSYPTTGNGGIVNGMVSASIAGQGTSTAGLFDFLTYDATNGFMLATYSRTITTTQTVTTAANELLAITPASGQTVTVQDTGSHPYAMIVNATTASPTISGTITLGNGTGQAGLILNTTAVSGTATLLAGAGGKINFGQAEGVLWLITGGAYLSTTNTVMAGTGGLTLAGNASSGIQLSSSNTFSGGININTGVLMSSTDGMFGDPANVVTTNGGGFYGNLTNNDLSTARSLVITSAGALFDANNHDFSFAGNISGPGTIKVTGAGTANPAFLSGKNSFGGLILSSGVVNAASDDSLGGATSTLMFSGGGLSVMGNSLTSFGSHPLIFTSGSALTLGIQSTGNTFTVNQPLALGNGVFTKIGAGTLVLTAPNTYTGATNISGGTLKVDASLGGSLSASTAPTIGGSGNLLLKGASSGTTSQTLGNLTVAAGGGTLTVDNNGATYNLTLGTVAIGTNNINGASLNIVPTGSGTSNITTTTTAATLANGLLGPIYVFNSADWATVTNANTNNLITCYTGYTTVAASATPSGSDGNNSQLNATSGSSGAVTVGGNWTTNSLKIADGSSLSLGSNTLTLTSGGLLFTGSGSYNLTGGNLMAGYAPDNGGTTNVIVHSYGSGTLTINSNIANSTYAASALTVSGSGKVTLGAANTFTGGVFINNGATLSVSNINQLGATAASTITISGSTLQYTGASASTTHPIAINSSGTIDVTGGAVLTLGGAVSGRNLTVTGSDGNSGDTVVLNVANSFTDGLNINSGIVRVGIIGALNSGSGNVNTVSIGSGTTAKLQLNGISTTIAGLSSASTNAVVENGNGSAANATLTVNMGDNETYAGTLVNQASSGTGTLAVNKGGGGTWTLSGANTFTGLFTIQNGGVSVSSIGNAASTGNLGAAANAAGTSAPIQIGYGASSGALIYTGGGENTNRNINLAGLAGGATLDASGTTSSSSPLELSGAISTVTSLGTAVTGAASKTLTIQGTGFGQIDGGIADASVTAFNGTSGTGIISLAKTGSGIWVLNGANTYSGATSITGGTLQISGSGSINNTSGITINGGTLQYSSSTGLTQPVSFSGTGGKLVLDGTSSYAGAINVTSGNTLSGHGTYSNSVTIASGGTLSPGNSPGQLTVGTLLLNGGSTSHMEIGGATIGTQYDNVTITSAGGLTYGGTLELVSYAPYTINAQSGSYTLFSFTGGYSGELSTVTVDGFALTNSSGVWTGTQGGANYSFTDSTGVFAVTIPEPGTISLAIGVASLGLMARRRRRA